MLRSILHCDMNNFYIVCENASYIVKSIVDDSIIATIAIFQDEKGIDKEDRVQKLKNYLGSKTIP